MSAPNPITLSYLGAIPGSFTGSIGAASNQLTLTTSSHGIRPGHDVIVETGGEAGGGELGTVGVGGTSPALSYPDTATLLAATPASETATDGRPTQAYAEDTGLVYYRSGAAWTQPPAKYVELRTVIPLALRARVIAVSGATLTLDTAATVASSDARVYVDIYRLLYRLLNMPGSTVEIDGEYAMGQLLVTDVSAKPDISLFGNGPDSSRIFSPRGCPMLTMRINVASGIQVGNLELERMWTGDAIWNGSIGYLPPTSNTYMHAISVHSSPNARLSGLRIVNALHGSALMRLSNDAEIRDVEAVHSGVFLRYYAAQWAIALSDCARTGIVDCSYDADVLSEALEIHAGDSCYVDGFTARNGLGASNSNINCDYSRLDFTVDNAAAEERAALETFSPGALLNWNNNFVDIDAEGGSLSDSTFTIDPSAPAEVTTQLPQLFVRHSALQAALDPITMSNVTFATNGLVAESIEAIGGSPVQDLNINGVIADAKIRLRHGSVTNTTAPELEYCPSDVTLGSGNDIDTLTENCA